tara:strand:- start:742 stop:1008 length:267 start_codon:yes stop_codon:yes gene_type:complete
MKVWNGRTSGHNYNKVIDHYKMIFSSEQKNILEQLQSFSIWDGRFPFPKDENLTILFEKGKGKSGTLNKSSIDKIQNIIDEQIAIMSQ